VQVVKGGRELRPRKPNVTYAESKRSEPIQLEGSSGSSYSAASNDDDAVDKTKKNKSPSSDKKPPAKKRGAVQPAIRINPDQFALSGTGTLPALNVPTLNTGTVANTDAGEEEEEEDDESVNVSFTYSFFL